MFLNFVKLVPTFIKVTWMVWWRWLVLGMMLSYLKDIFPVFANFSFMYESVALLVIMPPVLAAIIVFGFKKTIRSFPELLIFFSQVKIFIDPKWYAGKKKPVDDFERTQYLKRATNKGRSTGYEPRVLDKIAIPQGNSRMHGTPGSGLDQSGFSSHAIKAGQTGETNFAKALTTVTPSGVKLEQPDFSESFLKNVHTFWSMSIPSRDSTPYSIITDDNDADVDLVIALKNRLILVDLKFYKGGDVTYKSKRNNSLVTIDKATKKQVGTARRMSQNMKIAQERYTQVFPNMTVESMVVLVPTNSGAGTINSVYWPGNIKLYNIDEALSHITKDAERTANGHTVVSLKGLVK